MTRSWVDGDIQSQWSPAFRAGKSLILGQAKEDLALVVAMEPSF